MTDPVGEDGWLALVDEASRTARDLEQRVGVVELYKQSIAAEPWSLKLWLAYCEWVWSLYTDCQNGDAGWPEEEQLLGQELFGLETVLDVWQQGSQATQYRLNDSHELWNRWISIELEQLAKSPTPEMIERIRRLYLERLQTPHSTWDGTSQSFSGFLTRFDEPSWESTMVQTTKLTRLARELYEPRELYELKLRQATESGDLEAQKAAMWTYLDWEATQAERKDKKGVRTSPSILCVALYERALASTPLGLEPTTWEDYLDFVSSMKDDPKPHIPELLSVVQRATNHCPWSGILWARYIEIAESEELSFESMERIKHAATNTNPLDRDGMGGVVEFFMAWAGYLKRRTLAEDATDEDIDVTEMGLPTALESVQDWGQRVYGKKDYKGDPQFRIERIIIQHLSLKGSVEEARQMWKKLISTHADSYEFWQQYYFWEMTLPKATSVPTHATTLLSQAVQRRNLDWPEKILEIYLQHCINYEDVETLLLARRTVRRVAKKVMKRREREAAEAAAMYATQQPEALQFEADNSPSGVMKRKREEVHDEQDSTSNKKAKKTVQGLDEEALRQQHLKRDRENTTIIVTNLPHDVTQTKVKQYFKDYGHINSLNVKTEVDGHSSTALVEFQSSEDVQSALLRDQKYFADKQIRVAPGTELTLYVTNFPPSADDNYLRDVFKDCGEIFSIRWPSLKHNTHRRFCYMSFRTKEAAALATQLDGRKLEGVYKLVAKYSDPANKKSREGALAEGREIHITSLDKSLTEHDLEEVFSQYGKVERTRILRTRSGESTGAGFVAFGNKSEAEAALAMDKTKLKSSVLKVELSVPRNFKPIARSLGKGSSASPGPDADGDSAMSPSPAPEYLITNTHAQHAGRPIHTSERTITLMNIPDTVNDARIRVIAEPHGEIVKLVLRPDHQGAILEFADTAAAGRAALALENHEIVPGWHLRTGGLKDLFKEKGEKNFSLQTKRNDKAPPTFIQPATPVRRPGGRGGLGVKRGLGFAVARDPSTATTAAAANGHKKGVEKTAPKSNADFKAMFIRGEE